MADEEIIFINDGKRDLKNRWMDHGLEFLIVEEQIDSKLEEE